MDYRLFRPLLQGVRSGAAVACSLSHRQKQSSERLARHARRWLLLQYPVSADRTSAGQPLPAEGASFLTIDNSDVMCNGSRSSSWIFARKFRTFSYIRASPSFEFSTRLPLFFLWDRDTCLYRRARYVPVSASSWIQVGRPRRKSASRPSSRLFSEAGAQDCPRFSFDEEYPASKIVLTVATKLAEGCLATGGPITIASGQAELNLRKTAFGRREKRDTLHSACASADWRNAGRGAFWKDFDENKLRDEPSYVGHEGDAAGSLVGISDRGGSPGEKL